MKDMGEAEKRIIANRCCTLHVAGRGSKSNRQAVSELCWLHRTGFCRKTGSKCAHQATSTKGPQMRAYVPLYTGPGLQVGFSPALSTGWLLSKNNSPQHVTIIKQPAYALSTIMYLHHTAKKKTWRHTRIISLHPFAALPEGGTMRV